jgi:hypothetical protein
MQRWLRVQSRQVKTSGVTSLHWLSLIVEPGLPGSFFITAPNPGSCLSQSKQHILLTIRIVRKVSN